MIRFFILLILIITVNSRLDAAFLTVNNQPQSAGRGNLAASSEVNRQSPFNTSGSFQIGAAYSIPYGLSELTRQSVSTALPLFEHSLIISLENFGNTVYRENSAFIAYPLYRSAQIMLVPTLQYNYLSSNEKNCSAAAAGLAFLLLPTKEIEIISSVSNAVGMAFKGESAEANYQLSCRYLTTSNLALFLGVEKDQNSPAVVKSGAEITLLEKIRLQAGYNFEPALYTTGFDLLLGSWNFAYAFTYHDQLGFSQLAGLSFKLK